MDLTDAELEELDQLLSETPKPLSPLDVVLLDGYLCAVLVQPRLVPVSEWLPPIFDTDRRAWSVHDDPAFARHAARIEVLATRRLAALNTQLAEEAWFDPLIPPPDEEQAENAPALEANPEAFGVTAAATAPSEAPAAPSTPALTADQIRATLAPWASGFEYGLAVIPDFNELLEAVDEGSATPGHATLDPAAASLALAHVLRSLDAVDDGQAVVLAELDRAQPLTTLDDAIDELVGGVADLWDLTQPARYRVEPRRLEAPKAGRNDPCPCGSGRKFKRCHGA